MDVLKMISSICVLFIVLMSSNLADVINKRQNAYINITSYALSNINEKHHLLLFDSILFGHHSPQHRVEGKLIKAISINNSNSANNYGCSPYTNQDLPSKYIVIVSRGVCSFEQKIKIAYQSNATAIIVYNTENSAFIMHSNSSFIFKSFFKFGTIFIICLMKKINFFSLLPRPFNNQCSSTKVYRKHYVEFDRGKHISCINRKRSSKYNRKSSIAI